MEHTYLDLPPIEIKHANRQSAFNMKMPHQHNSYEIYYLLDGERNYFIKDRTYHIYKGDLVLIPPHIIHKTTTINDSNEHERLLINIRDSYLLSLMDNLHSFNWFGCFNESSPVFTLELPLQKKIQDHLFLIYNTHKHHNENLVKLLLLQLLIMLNEHLHSQHQHIRLSPFNLKESKVHSMVTYINEHYAEPISLETLSKKFYLSSYYICRIFKEVTGFSFNEYLNQVRILEAKKYLQRDDLTITDISFLVGFGSITHFGRVFKKVTHMSPGQYKKSGEQYKRAR